MSALTAPIVVALVAGAGTSVVLGRARAQSVTQHWVATRLDSADNAANLVVLDDTAQNWAHSVIRYVTASAAVGLVLALIAWTVLGPPALALVVIGGLLGLGLSRLSLRSRATKMREVFEHAAVEMAELVSLGLAGGLGLARSLKAAGQGLGSAVAPRFEAMATGFAPWQTIESFGIEAKVEVIADLGRVLTLGAEEGAKTKDLLLEWALTQREVMVARDEGHAADMTESMTVSLTLVGFGYLLFLIVPAGAALLGVHFGGL